VVVVEALVVPSYRNKKVDNALVVGWVVNTSRVVVLAEAHLAECFGAAFVVAWKQRSLAEVSSLVHSFLVVEVVRLVVVRSWVDYWHMVGYMDHLVEGDHSCSNSSSGCLCPFAVAVVTLLGPCSPSGYDAW